MLVLTTGKGGASKSLNTVAALIKANDGTRPHYYTNIKLFMLDYAVASSFQGWFYGYYLYHLKDKKGKAKLLKIMKTVHADEEQISLKDVPWLESYFEAHNPIDTWLFWVYRLYTKQQLKTLSAFIDNVPDSALTFDNLERFNLHFSHFEDARKWYVLPKTSVILIDECQHFFPPRQTGSTVPKHIAEFSTHRHRGYDIHLITQDRMFLDVNARKLANKHIHYHNPFGGERVTRYEHSEQFDSSNYFDLQKTQKSFIKRPKEFYGSYFSAELHTHKFKMPKAVYAAAALVVFLAVLGFVFYNTFFSEQATASADTSPEVAAKVEEKNVQARVVTDTTLKDKQQDSLTAYVAKAIDGVFIDGSMKVYHDDGLKEFHYSFSKKSSSQTFIPENIGFTVIPVTECLVRLELYDYSTFVTCDPFYKAPEIEREQQDDLFLAGNAP